MRGSLFPVASLKGESCHHLEIEMKGPWGDFAIPAGMSKQHPGEIEWMFIKLDTFRLYLDLGKMDEDKVLNQAIFSLEHLSQHADEVRPRPDTPMVMLSTSGINENMTVVSVELDKVHSLHGEIGTAGEMGLSMDQRRLAVIPFSDQQHADAFQKAVQKAITLCKVQ